MKGRSADTILPEHQALAVGDIVPTDPNGGFEVRILEPERALVLFVDSEIVARRTDEARIDAASTPGLAASGRFMQASMPPEFAVSWAIVLQPLDGGRTRLIERVRATYASTTARHTRLRADARLRRVPHDAPPDARPRSASHALRGGPAGPRPDDDTAAATWLAGEPDERHDLTDVVPAPPTREGPAPANGHAPDLAEATPAP